MHSWTASLLSLVGLAALMAMSADAIPAPPNMPFTPEKFSPEGFPISKGAEMHLIETATDKGQITRKWLSDKEVSELGISKKSFMDVTFHADRPTQSFAGGRARVASFPTEVQQQNATSPILETISKTLPTDVLTKLTEFNNRYYRSTTGGESSDYIFATVKEIANRAKDGVKVTVKQFEHSWIQKSVIARIEGQADQNETVIVGAHQDSINLRDRLNGRAPGADDDGSGTVSILETFRALIDYGFKPNRPVEFQWYSGEEAGLLGSQDISASYKKAGREVAGMLQLDMTGTPTKDGPPNIGLVTDYVNDKLTDLVESIIKTYITDLTIVRFKCGYGCSDHASWNRTDYTSAFPFESGSLSNSDIHTPRDTIEKVNFDHVVRFSKIAVSFVVEVANAS